MVEQNQSTQFQKQLTEEENTYLSLKAEYVLFLINASLMPSKVKTAWVVLLPHMNLSQVDRLIKLIEDELEVMFVETKKYPEDQELILKLKAVQEKYESRVSMASNKTVSALQKLEQSLPNVSI